MVYAHPDPGSFSAAVLATVTAGLDARGAEVRVRDLYAEGFEPRLSAEELSRYLDEGPNRASAAREIADLEWCDTLIFVYPTWWYGLPAMLKGWLDRVMVPGVAFRLPPPEGGAIRPGLRNVTTLAAFTSGGASRWLTALMGAPGRRTLLRGVRSCCARGCRTAFAMHYGMDRSTDESRAAHLRRVARKVAAL